MESPAPQILQKPASRRNYFLIFAGIILLLLVVLILYFGKFYLSFLPGKTTNGPVGTKQVKQIQTSPLLSNQTALVRGVVVARTDNQITVKGENGQTDSFSLQEPVVIYNQIATSSASLNLGSIELNKPAVITLELKDNKYRVISISYFIPPPPPGS